jgi:hypothetical protein
MVSGLVLTAEPLDAVLLPVLPMELDAWLRTALADDPEDEFEEDDAVAQALEAEGVDSAVAAADFGVDDVIGAKVDDEDDVDDVEDEVVVVGDVMVEPATVVADNVIAPVAEVESVVDPADVVPAALVAAEEVDVDDVDPDDVVDDDEVDPDVLADDDDATDAGEHTVVAPLVATVGPDTKPGMALVVWVPLAVPPEVLM